jgi:hypothetical protein
MIHYSHLGSIPSWEFAICPGCWSVSRRLFISGDCNGL